MKKVIMMLVINCAANMAFSQSYDSLKSVSQGTDTLEVLKHIKIQGLIQTQFQKFGPDAEEVNNRLTIRRASLKVSYSNAFSQFVFQFHATEKNVGPDEIYSVLTEPWTKTVSLTTGIFNRPFGNEIAYSSTLLESDERSRVTKMLFPDEKDLGAMISFHPRQTSSFNFLWLDAGVFNGTGPSHVDFDKRKNFIGHIYTKNIILAGQINLGMGVSWYKGGFSNQRRTHFGWNHGFTPLLNDSLALSEQDLKGLDAQLSLKWTLGITRVRFEYIAGKQAGTYASSKTPSTAPADKYGNALPSFIRNCEGGYLILIHEIAKARLQLVFKYDWYDPNTQLSGAAIGQLDYTGTADILYRNYGMGINYLFNKNIKLSAYLNIVKNEKTTLPWYSKDINDNNITLRLQYSF